MEEVGTSVSQELIGKRVLPLRGEGTWQEFVKASAELVVPIPNFIDDYIAAQLYINPVTVWLTCTEVLKLKPDDVLLVNACGSSIGRIFAQFSKILGFRLIASVGGLYSTDLAFCIRPNGTFLTIGLLSGKPVNWAEITYKANFWK